MKQIKKKFKSQIYCDTADITLISKLSKNSIVKGFTTNPSLMRAAGAKDYKKYATKLIKICNKKPISLEVFADKENEIETQANIIKTWGKNVYVKIPVLNTKGKFLGKTIKKLSYKGFKLNITAVYSVQQVRMIIKSLNKNSKTIISIFSGRMADVGKDPLPIIKKSVALAKKYKNIKILWASTREPYNYIQSSGCMCDIITMPPSIIEKISKFGKSFKILTLNTVKTFYKDALKAKFKIK
jgi:transaldolase